MRTLTRFLLLLALVPSAAHAWWNADWTQRKALSVDPVTAVGFKAPLAQAVVPVRLHTGNFAFNQAKPDGSDLRFVAADDKTLLKHHVELFDPANDLAIVWVQVPRIAPGGVENIWLYFGNAKAPSADDPKGTWDASQVAAFHFAERDGAPRDSTGFGNNPTRSSARLGAEGAMGAGAQFQGGASMELAASPSLALARASGFTFSAWIRTAGAQSATLYEQSAGNRFVRIGLQGDRLVLQVASGTGRPTEITSSEAIGALAWQHIAVTVKDRATLYVNGNPSAARDLALPEISGNVTLGAAAGGANGFAGEMDEVQLASTERSGDWVVIAATAQGAQAGLVTIGEADGAGGESTSYMRILLDAVTIDGWIVIVILMVMLVIALWVMLVKTIAIARAEAANRKFRERFSEQGIALTGLTGTPPPARLASVGAMAVSGPLAETFRGSQLARLLDIATQELKKRAERDSSKGQALKLTPQAIDTLKASLDAGYVRETAKLNSQLVLLTIAISGGPFLGLLGTVVGVMITFAAIAAAGDVNVNSIAPGIAAALVATVAGLAVAIPALFGYNWLATRIKEVTNDMQVFIDEVVTRVAEAFSS